MPEAEAPGKLLLCGEYAVLHGAPALVAAVGVRARAAVTPASDGHGRLEVAGDGGWDFEVAAGAPRWREAPPAGQGRVLEAVGATLAARGIAWPAAHVGLDTRAFTARRADGAADKLGLGSSAAVTVALARALVAAAGRPAPEGMALFELALEAHRRLQGGSGSGADVAAAVHGGVVALLAGRRPPRAESLAWPAGLHALAVWSGRGASTTALVARFAAFAAAEPTRCAERVGALCAAAEAALAAWRGADVAALLAALAAYGDGLDALDAAAGIGIGTPAHAALAVSARAAGAVYKVSGAGGGDFGIAFAADAAAIAGLAQRWRGAGRVVIELDGRAPGAG
jgi:phosphomevalonate kinase